MGSISPERADPERAGGGGNLVPATALATVGAGGGGRAPAEPDRADTVGWLLALALPGLLALCLLARPLGERVALVVTNLASLAGPLIACWLGLRRRGRGRPGQSPVPSGETPSTTKRRFAGANASLVCLAAAGLLCASGQLLSYGAALLFGDVAPVSWVGYFLAYPCLIAGVLLLPLRRKSLLARGRAV